MVRQVKMTPAEDQAVPELTGLDQLTDEERQRIAARMPPSAGTGTRARQGEPRPAPEPAPAPAPEPEMTRRSWYTEKGASDALAAAVDDLHFATRVPKHQVVSALFRLAAEHHLLALEDLRRSGEHS